MEHVGDFFKPRRKIDNSFLSEKNTTVQKLTNSDKEILDFYYEEPVFDGQYSNKCYQDRINEGLEHFQSQKKIDFLKSTTTRPLRDFIKENIFNIINHSN